MKRHMVFSAFATILLPIVVFGQEKTETTWEIMPSIALVRYFPGEPVFADGGYGPILFGPEGSNRVEARYAGTGMAVSIRFFHESLPNIALTLGGGINWYSGPDQPHYAVMSLATAGVGQIEHNRTFTTFPLSVGAQVVYPRAGRQSMMFFAGGEFTVHFVDGDLDIRQQAKLGYGLVGGFAVKIFEFGVRYSAFSDMKNLGAHIGLRFNPFTL